MPLTAKGTEIEKAMESTYGSKEKAEQVLYASKNAGKITGIDSAKDDFAAKLDAACAGAATLENRVDMRLAKSDDWSPEAREAAAEARAKSGGYEEAGSGFREKAKAMAERAAARKKDRESNKNSELTNLGRGPLASSGVNKKDAIVDDHRVIGGVQIQPNASQIANTLGMRFDEKKGGGQ